MSIIKWPQIHDVPDPARRCRNGRAIGALNRVDDFRDESGVLARDDFERRDGKADGRRRSNERNEYAARSALCNI